MKMEWSGTLPRRLNTSRATLRVTGYDEDGLKMDMSRIFSVRGMFNMT
jgi:hypothetical protein